MLNDIKLKLASLIDATSIACMSRELIEYDLPWSWDARRVAYYIRCHDAVVLTARAQGRIVGFAIMHFREASAHLNLLAVQSHYRHLGIGSGLVTWLEKSARVAGTFIVSLEVRANNRGAHVFYRKLGYIDIVSLPGYYRGREAAIRMSKDLRCGQRLPSGRGDLDARTFL
ncbi:MAG: GNAT family N-acetyltransferase [Acidiferrobacterales bacterium]